LKVLVEESTYIEPASQAASISSGEAHYARARK